MQTRDTENPQPYRVGTCRGAAGCRRAVGDVSGAATLLDAALDRGEVRDLVLSKCVGPLREHNLLRLAVAGCPNACSRPQIVDYGLIAARRPVLDVESCDGCGACARVCEESAVVIDGASARFDLGSCVGCGACVAACPNEALSAVEGWRVLAGGRLGRHPALAVELDRDADLSSALDRLQGILDTWRDHGSPGERIGAVLDRVTESRG